MKPVSGKKFAKALDHNGWSLLRVNCSHHIYGKEGSVVRLSIPIHGAKLLKTGLMKHLMRKAGLTEKDLK